MQIDYNIREMGVHKKYEGIENVVYELRMDVEGNNDKGYTGKFFHVMYLNLNKLDKDSFVLLDALKKSDVVNWIESNLDEATRQYFVKEFEEMFTPTTFYHKPGFDL